MGRKCFFCDLWKGDMPNKILENDEFFSMYDDSPVSPGHALVIPKKHVVSFFEELKPDYIARLYDFIRITKNEVDKKHNPDGYNIGINDGRAAGRTIDHLHIHIIPRYKGDEKNPRGGVRNLFSKNVPP